MTLSAIWFWPVVVVKFNRINPLRSTLTEACAAPLSRMRTGVPGSKVNGTEATGVVEGLSGMSYRKKCSKNAASYSDNDRRRRSSCPKLGIS